jgi:predicted acyltransferase
MTVQPNKRLLSLDVFRGATVAAMILVNNPGDWDHIYAPLEHSEWNGCTPTDLIFPFFLFIVGVSIVFAMEAKKADPAQHKSLLLNLLRRTAVLALLALGMSGFPFFKPANVQNIGVFQSFLSVLQTIRIPGVLMRIAISFGIAGFIYLKTTRKTQLWLLGIFLVTYYILMNFVPVPDFGPANLDAKTNLGAWVDRSVFGTAHLWKSSVTWDPEGLLGTMTAVATVLFGIQIGTWLKRKDRDDATKIAWMFTIGVAAAIAGKIWGLFFPINKALWTSSFVLYTGGLATVFLAISYWLIDVQGYKKFTAPFVAFGTNAIFVFVASGVIARSMNMIKVHDDKEISLGGHLFNTYFKPHFSPLNASLAYAIITVLFWFIIVWIFYKRKIIIKV